MNLRSPLRGSREREREKKTYISVYASVSFATRSPELEGNFLFPWLYRRYRGGRGGWGGADTVKGGAHGEERQGTHRGQDYIQMTEETRI